MSYVRTTDLGGMAEHIRSLYTISDGDLMIEANGLPDKFCICFQIVSKKSDRLEAFCKVMDELGLPYTVSERLTRYLPEIQLPK